LPPRLLLAEFLRFVTSPALLSSRATVSAEPVLAKRSKIRLTSAASRSTTTSRRFSTS
jgi:hypothetical protein